MLVALYQEEGESVQPAMQAEATEQTEKTTVEVLFYFEHVYPESVIFSILESIWQELRLIFAYSFGGITV